MIEPLSPEVAILNAALELPTAQRHAYLDKACGRDAALREQVEALLRAHEQADDFLEASPASFANIGNISTEKPGDKIGHHKLLQQIGEGGCGIVYMAEQEEPVRRRVALKVIRLGMDTRSIIARFEAERQALAMMDHPNIAKVLDAGATHTGRPFFVMELVRGTRITDYCDNEGLSTRERLDLFVQVCRAVQHAHQKGIIHRDIKPSNILVTLNDGVSVPKVIDFGIAKATQGRLTDKTLFTAFEQFIGTPAYMSPEQAVMTTLDIDTRSDIYSLGVLLYELLTGRTPFDAKQLLAAGLDQMRRIIQEEDPPRPSTRLGTLVIDELTTAAKTRKTDAPKLIHLVRGDLDWIVMKCLEKDRTRRYETANGLATDIGRHLNHEPVNARPPTGLYRIRKLIRRNKLAFAAGGALVVALVIVAVGSTMAAWRVAGARRAEQQERQKAETANRQLRGTISLMELERAEDLFRAHDAAQGVAHLAAVLRRDPANHLAANRLVSALLHRDWALQLAAPMRHMGQVDSVWFSPDGQRLLSASHDGTVKIWEAATDRVVATVGHGGRIFQARYSPDGRRFVTACADGTARIWNAADGSSVAPPLVHMNRVYWAEFSPDGQQVVTASADRTARVWDAASGALKHELRKHTSHVVVARFGPDCKTVATGGSHGSIRLWSLDTGETLHRVEDRNTNLTALAFSPDGRRLLTACADGIARLWDVSTGQPAGKPLMHRKPIEHVAFSPDSRMILTASQDGTARLWHVETGEPAGPPLVHQGGVIFGTFSPDGQRVVTTSMDNSARLWNVRTGTPLGQPLREHERILHADFSPDGRRLVTASYNWNVRLWDIQPRQATAMEINAGQRTTSVAFNPDGKAVLTADEGGTARVWDASSGQPGGAPMQQPGWIHSGAFSPDGRQLILASTFRSTHVRNRVTGAIVSDPFEHTKGLWFACFSPDGGCVATASEDRTARVWNAQTGQPITPTLTHPSAVKLARFSPDGKQLLTFSKEHARVWNAETGVAVTDPLAHIDHVKWAEFSPDGKRVVTASTDNTACIWEVSTGRPAAPLLRHARIVEKAVFSPDGGRVATASIDRTARIWDTLTGQALTPALPHDSEVMQVCFSPDGRRLLTVNQGGSVRLWDSETGRPLTESFDEDRGYSACFDQTGGCIAIGGRGAHVWAVPSAAAPVPEWFLTFAEGVGGIRLDARGNSELVLWPDLENVKGLPGAGQEEDFYRRLARWFVADPLKRPVTPF
jgi:eukaryotic-like serine/threonine-protein kinase